MTTLTRGSKDHSTATITAESITDPTVSTLISVFAPWASAVIGSYSAVAASTFTLQGSHDGTLWIRTRRA